MNTSIITQLTDLRARYTRHLARLEASDMDPLFKRYAMRQTQQGIDELDVQIAKEEEQGAEPLHDDISEAKRYKDCQKQ